MAVDAYINTANVYLNRLLDEIFDYHLHNGEPPKFIMATTRAYWLIENYSKEFLVLNKGSQLTPSFRGIEIRVVSGDGFDVFLAGEPITLRA